jgi:hypothetical protein
MVDLETHIYAKKIREYFWEPRKTLDEIENNWAFLICFHLNRAGNGHYNSWSDIHPFVKKPVEVLY